MAIFSNIDNNDPVCLIENYIDTSDIAISFDLFKECKDILTEAVDPDEGWGNLLRPVFIVVVNQGNGFSKFGDFIKDKCKTRDGSKEVYWHAAMGFGPNLKHLYSFSSGHEIAGNNKFKGGLSFESIDYYKKWYAKDATMQVSCILLTKEHLSKVKETLDYYIRNKEKTSYHTKGLIDVFFAKGKPDKMRLSNICSQFVDSVLRNSGITVSKRLNNLTSPTDLSAAEGDRKRFVVYEGKIADYSVEKVSDKIEDITQKKENEYFEKVEDKESK